MRKQLTAFVLGFLVAVAAVTVKNSVDRRRPEVFVDSADQYEATLVFRYKDQRLAVTVPVIRTDGPAYTTRAFVWNYDLTEGPDQTDVELYAQEHTPQPLPWTAAR